jgi:hypothetical protein
VTKIHREKEELLKNLEETEEKSPAPKYCVKQEKQPLFREDASKVIGEDASKVIPFEKLDVDDSGLTGRKLILCFQKFSGHGLRG